MEMLFNANGSHYKVTKIIDEWLLSNCKKFENSNFFDGIGYYNEHTVFSLLNGEYCIIISNDNTHKLKQEIVQLKNEQLKEVKIHKWLKVVI